MTLPDGTVLDPSELDPADLEPPVLGHVPDIRLIAVDMDGTLLHDDQVDDSLWPLLRELDRRGIVFCPASGRQYANVHDRFAGHDGSMVFIAENGAYVVRDGVELSSAGVGLDVVADLVRTVRALGAGSGGTGAADVGMVLCGKRSAYIERLDPAFVEQADRYYLRLEQVEDLLAVRDDEVLKVAVFDFGSAQETTAPALARFRATQQVVVSGEHWVDVMHPGANKGVALRRVQELLGATPAQTMAFGDYLNDLELMDAADYSFAMANAHPTLLARARYVAPPNTRNGVVRTIAATLGIPLPA